MLRPRFLIYREGDIVDGEGAVCSSDRLLLSSIEHNSQDLQTNSAFETHVSACRNIVLVERAKLIVREGSLEERRSQIPQRQQQECKNLNADRPLHLSQRSLSILDTGAGKRVTEQEGGDNLLLLICSSSSSSS